MSPIAPSLSSSLVVPSSITLTSGRVAAHSRKCGANFAFVATYVRSAPIPASDSSTRSSIGRPPTGSSALGWFSVSG